MMVQHLSRAVGGRVRGGAIACAVLAVGCLALGGVFVRLSEVGPIATGGFRSLIAVPMPARHRGRTATQVPSAGTHAPS